MGEEWYGKSARMHIRAVIMLLFIRYCTAGMPNVGIVLPDMHKSDLFKTVVHDGALPRKTFSMGEADEKRFYYECRRIQKD